MVVTLSTSKARQQFAETLGRVSKGERIVLCRQKKAVAAIVPIEDLELLRAIEDRFDARAGQAALEEASLQGTIPWEKVKAALGL